MEKALTKSDYLQLLGLFALFKHHYMKGRELEKVIVEKLGGEFNSGDEVSDWVNDVVFGDESFDVDRVLDRLGIEVEDLLHP